MTRNPSSQTLGQAAVTEEPDGTEEEVNRAAVWRYPEMCRHWGVSRATVERWVRRFENTGQGIPVHRDPSGRPYWLPAEASADAQPVHADRSDVATTQPDRLTSLRRAASRGRRAS